VAEAMLGKSIGNLPGQSLIEIHLSGQYGYPTLKILS
jgi:hypothetical protein